MTPGDAFSPALRSGGDPPLRRTGSRRIAGPTSRLWLWSVMVLPDTLGTVGGTGLRVAVGSDRRGSPRVGDPAGEDSSRPQAARSVGVGEDSRKIRRGGFAVDSCGTLSHRSSPLSGSGVSPRSDRGLDPADDRAYDSSERAVWCPRDESPPGASRPGEQEKNMCHASRQRGATTTPSTSFTTPIGRSPTNPMSRTAIATVASGEGTSCPVTATTTTRRDRLSASGGRCGSSPINWTWTRNRSGAGAYPR